VAIQGSAANLVEVRVGSHADFTRVVLETDAPVRYELTRSEGGELRVRLFATATPRRLASKSPLLREVVVEADAAGSIARLALKKRGLVDVKEMVLDKPPRIVLDLTPRLAGAPAPEPGLAKVEPAPAPAPLPAPPAAEPEAQAAPSEPAPAGEEVRAEAEPEAEPEVSPTPRAEVDEGEVGPETGAAPDPARERDAAAQAELDRLAGIEPQQEAQPTPAEDAQPAAPPEPLEADDAESDPAEAEGYAIDEPAEPAEVAATPPRDLAPAPGGLSFLPSPLDDPLVLGVVTSLLVLVAALSLLRRRSARASDAESLASPFASSQPFAYAGSGAAAQPSGVPGSDAAMGPLFASAATQGAEAQEASGASLFDVAEDDASSDYEPEVAPYADPGIDAAPSATTSYKGDSLEGDDMRVIEELERRLAHLETRLEEVVDAKERLERHVAAQTEELRVQRAAIARTQRVLRTVVKPDDLATEPAPKV
jgi:hypothetical protein